MTILTRYRLFTRCKFMVTYVQGKCTLGASEVFPYPRQFIF